MYILLPVKEILKQHLDIYENNNADIQKRINSNDIREMLLKEIKNIANTTDSNDNVGFYEEPEKIKPQNCTWELAENGV